MTYVPVTSLVPHINNTHVNNHALNILVPFAIDAIVLILQFSLSSLLFGVLTVLATSSVFLLLRRRASTNTPLIIPLLSTVVLYASTGLYMVSLIWNWTSVAHIILEAQEGLLLERYNGDADLLFLENAVFKQSWMATAALGANMLVGDAVVWWRACVIWRHKAIYYAGPIALLLALVFGIVGALQTWQTYRGPMPVINFVMGDSPFVDAAAVLSLATNFTATILISVKAFFHKRCLNNCLGSSGGQTRVLKVFALLIESGCVYCVILLVVLLYQFKMYTAGSLIKTEYFLIYGCLVPLIAIYPTSIVFLTALDWSPLDRGLSEPSQAPLGASHAMRRQP